MSDRSPYLAPNEGTLEQATVQRLTALGYEHKRGGTLREDENGFPLDDMVHRETLCWFLTRQNPHLPSDAIRSIVTKAAAPIGEYRSFLDMLDSTLQRYHAVVLTAAEVIKAMAELRQDMEAEDSRKAELGLSDEELAFCDAIAGLRLEALDSPYLAALIHDVVEVVKKHPHVGWTKPHHESMKARVAAA